MSYESVIKNTKKIESLLVEMGAEGQGLHKKVSSIEYLIDEKTVKSIRFIASVRNKLLHEDNFEMTSDLLYDFENACKNVINNLEQHTSYTKEQNDSSDYQSQSNYSSSSSSSDLSGWELLGLGIAGAVAVYSWFNS